MNKNTLTMAH